MTILTVGAEQQFKTIHDAVAASKDGDTIYVQAGVYVNDFATINHKISLIGVGGMVQVVATKIVAKGALVVNNDATIDHFEFSGVKSWNFNGAGIRHQAGNLTVTNSYFHDNQDGILSTPLVMGVDSVTIKNSEFARNGAGDGQSHNMYIGRVANFTLTDSYSHDAKVGHEVKSRALNSTIVNNRIDDGNGTSSYSIDLPAGGNAVVENNIIRQGPNSQNKTTIAFQAEINKHPQWDVASLVLRDNTIINDMSQGKKPVGVANWGTSTVESDGNTIYGLTPAEFLKGSATSTNDHFTASTAPAVDTSHPFTPANNLGHIVSIGIGDDVLHGTAQNDLFVGGVGQDTFVITAGGGSDVIADFKAGPGAGDVVQLQGTSFKSFADVQAAMSQHGNDVWLDLGKGEVLTFQNVSVKDFAADDFKLVSAGASTSGLSGSDSGPAQVHLFKLPDAAKATTIITGSDTKDDLLTGTSGNDNFDGKKGADTMRGGIGDDHYSVDNAGDVIVEKSGEGIDAVLAKKVSFTLPDNVENLYLSGSTAQVGTGNELNNILNTPGLDTLNGMGGNDILETMGGGQLIGGTGNDIFHFGGLALGMSTITDFAIGQDLLDFTTLMKKYAGDDPVADGTMALRSDGHGGTIIAVDPRHSGTMVDVVDVQNVAPDALHMGYDYIF